MLSHLKLAPKFTLLLSLVFIGAIFFTGWILSQAIQQKAETQVIYRGRLLMATMNSVREYTSDHVNPLLKAQVETSSKFIPEIIPTFSAIKVFENFKSKPEYSEYSYKEAVLNPTNPRDQADEFDKELIELFQKEPNSQDTFGFRKMEGEEIFYKSQPIKITNPSCLRCHSTPEAAPKSQINTYGDKNGFGWPLNKIIGVQTIYVPSEEVFRIARRDLYLVMQIFIGVFAVVILLINWLLKRNVIEPVKPMARLAQQISDEDLNSEENEEVNLKKLEQVAKKSDELGQLARVFQQMAHAVYTREQSFAQQLTQLRQETDKAKKAGMASKITQKAYLEQLLEKARRARS